MSNVHFLKNEAQIEALKKKSYSTFLHLQLEQLPVNYSFLIHLELAKFKSVN